MRLRDRVAVITGGGSGLGKAIALRLAEEGARVAVVDINPDSSARTVEEIASRGGRARGDHLDITDLARLREYFDTLARAEGHIDVLINNAGITHYRAFESIVEADWEAVLRLDVKAVFFCAQAVSRYMTRQQYGKIVNIASSLGTGTTPHVGSLSAGAAAPYASAKAAVIQMTQILARELGPSGINVNCVAPGFFLTPLTHATRSPAEVEEHIRVRSEMAVLKRPGRLEELANAVLFLASDESSFITGETLCVDGGRTDRM
jgi:NAD(P)-dependent dehydrogenase (short-subunit alcohol dehydrogenase family)